MSDSEWKVEEHEIGQVTVVGQVLSVNVQATNTVYVLDDGTGRIEARNWADSEAPTNALKWAQITFVQPFPRLSPELISLLERTCTSASSAP